jgi:hypothetical protein
MFVQITDNHAKCHFPNSSHVCPGLMLMLRHQVMSSSPYFSEDPHASVVMTRSMWYTRSSDGCVELSRISGPSMTSFRDGQEVYCLRGPNINGGASLFLEANLGHVSF